MKARPLLLFSMTAAEYARLDAGGPRRDIPLLTQEVDGELLFRRDSGTRSGFRAKVFGPHVRHAWDAAARAHRDGVVFADGEHVGFPLAAALALRNKRRARLIVLGHHVDKPWKRALLWMATRCVARGTLVLHSRNQADSVKRLLPRSWQLATLPYQVDTAFWTAAPTPTARPLVVAVGSENRDYAPLIEAARSIDADFCIASGSHWARVQATAGDLPPNVRVITETLPFEALRDLYARAAVVVVPLYPVTNQSGITTILEGMSMARPVVVSATPGQREAITGPLVSTNGPSVAADRGPHVLGLPSDARDTGVYVAPGDAQALRHAIQGLLDDPQRARELGSAARQSILANFTVEQFARRFADVIERQQSPVGRIAAEVPQPR